MRPARSKAAAGGWGPSSDPGSRACPAQWLCSGAPFHHLVHFCLRQRRFGRKTFGSTAYLAAKAKGDRSMPSKRGASEDVYGVVPRDPHDMVKVGLLEPQSPA